MINACELIVPARRRPAAHPHAGWHLALRPARLGDLRRGPRRAECPRVLHARLVGLLGALRWLAVLPPVHLIRARQLRVEKAICHAAAQAVGRRAAHLLIQQCLVPRAKGPIRGPRQHRDGRRRGSNEQAARVDKVVVARAEQIERRAASEDGVKRVGTESKVGIHKEGVVATCEHEAQEGELENGRVTPPSEPFTRIGTPFKRWAPRAPAWQEHRLDG